MIWVDLHSVILVVPLQPRLLVQQQRRCFHQQRHHRQQQRNHRQQQHYRHLVLIRVAYSVDTNTPIMLWRDVWEIYNCFNRECSCPSTASIANEWNSQHSSDPFEGACANVYGDCCEPLCFDYSVAFNDSCPTTTTTTEGPTTTTSTTDPPEEPFFVVVCLEPRPCPNCPEKTQQTRRCVEFPNKDQASAYSRDLLNMGLLPIQGPGTCADAAIFQCPSCDSPAYVLQLQPPPQQQQQPQLQPQPKPRLQRLLLQQLQLLKLQLLSVAATAMSILA